MKTSSCNCACATTEAAWTSKNFEGRKPGHFGIPGMRERADLTGGHLEIWSKVGLGTEVNLIVLGDLARPAPGVRSRPRAFRGRMSTPS